MSPKGQPPVPVWEGRKRLLLLWPSTCRKCSLQLSGCQPLVIQSLNLLVRETSCRDKFPKRLCLPCSSPKQHSVALGATLLLLLLLSRFSRVRLCATPEMAAHQAPPSMGFSRQEYWSGVPLKTSFSRGVYLIATLSIHLDDGNDLYPLTSKNMTNLTS